MDLAAACDAYVDHLAVTRDLSPHTLRAYHCDLTALRRHVGSSIPVADLECGLVTGFFEAQRQAGRTAATMRRRAAALRRFFSWLEDQGLVEHSPWPDGGVASGRTRVLPRLVPARDLQRLITWMTADCGLDNSVPDAVLARPDQATTLLSVLLMATTGARVGEIVAMKCRDVDVADRSVRILGKGRRERQVYLVDDWISGLVESYRLTREALGVTSPWLLVNKRLAPLTAANVRSRLTVASRRAGLTSMPTPHMLRHTAATRLIEADVDIRYIQRLLGHASLTTTEIYTHVADPALRRAVTRAAVRNPLLMG